MGALAFEAVDGPFVVGAVLAHVGDCGVPLGELLVDIELVGEPASWEKGALDVLHTPLSTLPLVRARYAEMDPGNWTVR